jgi:hypothetical protein
LPVVDLHVGGARSGLSSLGRSRACIGQGQGGADGRWWRRRARMAEFRPHAGEAGAGHESRRRTEHGSRREVEEEGKNKNKT